MGTFLVNFHVRADDHDTLAREVRQLPAGGCWVTRPKDGWATVYEERASMQDDRWIREFGARLSERLDTAAIAFLVHDSDFLCYWLFDQGRLLDEFNSCPDYFDDEAGSGDANRADPAQHEVLLRFCRPNTQPHDVERVLNGDEVFAEQQLESLVELLGIDLDRAMCDYRDVGDQQPPDDIDAVFIGDNPPPKSGAWQGASIVRFPLGRDEARDDDDAIERDDEAERDEGAERDDEFAHDDDDEPRPGFLGRGMAQLLELSREREPRDPLVAELVQAAADGDVAEIDRLAALGVTLDGMAPLKLSDEKQAPMAARLLGGGGFAVPVSPLMAAVARKRVEAARRLIELGADVHGKHSMFGTALHGAAASGSRELVRLLLDAGADVNAVNAQGQTPLAALHAFRAMTGQLENLGALGVALPRGVRAELERLIPAPGDLDVCQRMLREHGGR